jgi:hypothetical protein
LQKLKSILNYLVEYNFIVALGALAMYGQTLILFDQAIEFSHYAYLLFFACLLDYNIHKLIKKQFHLSNEQLKKTVINMDSRVIILISITGIFINLFHLPSSLYLKLLMLASITALYSLPFFIKLRYINYIKKVPFLKTSMVAFVWSYLTLNIPVEMLNIELSFAEISPLFFARFFFIAAITLPFELRDKEIDQKDGIVTLAHVFTSHQIQILIIGLLLAMNILMGLCFDQNESLKINFAYAASSFLMLRFIFSNKINNNKYYYKLLLDGMLIWQSVLVYLIFKI